MQLLKSPGRPEPALQRVPSDRETKLLELLETFCEVKLDPIIPPDIWKLRVIQSVARKRIAEYAG